MQQLIGQLVHHKGFMYKVSSYNNKREKYLLSRRKSEYENDWVEVSKDELLKLEKVK